MFTHEQRGVGAYRKILSAGRATVALSAVAAAVVLVLAPAALAGEYEQAVCLNPSGSQAGTAGWSSSTSGTVNGGGAALSTPDCGPSDLGLPFPNNPMESLASSGGSSPVGALWTYTAPPNATIVGGQAVTDDGVDSVGLGGEGWLSVGQDSAMGQDNVFACFSTDPGCTGPAPAYTPFVAGDNNLTTFAIPDVPSATQMFLYATNCGPTSGCNGTAYVSLYSADIELQNTTAPQGSNFQGTLLQPNAHGTATLTFTASDAGGPGVASINVLIDGTSVDKAHIPNGTPDICQPVATDQSTGLPIYDVPAPCVGSANVSAQFATGALTDGTHDLKIQVTDAAGNIATVYDGPITTENDSTPSSTTTEKPGPAGTTGSSAPVVVVPPANVTVTTGKPSAPAPHYSLVLSAESRKLAGTKLIRRVFDHSALTLAGTVLGATGVGLADAPVKVVAIGPGGVRSTIATTRSNGSGAFAITAPPGDTRTLQLIGSDGTVTFHERVTPTISLKVDQLSTRTVRLTGRIGIRQGATHPQLELEIRDGTHWQLLGQTFVAGRDGAFSDTYTASPRAAQAHYQVRVVLLGTPDWTEATTKTETVVL